MIIPCIWLYFLTDNKWGKTALTYYYNNFTPDLSQSQVKTAVTRAFEVWSEVSSLTFTESSNSDADIIISFGAGVHGDIYAPFDGEGKLFEYQWILPKS